jgi:hypothetical protein
MLSPLQCLYHEVLGPSSGVASIHYTRSVGTGKWGKGQMSPIEIPKLWAGGPDSPFLALRERQSLPRKSFLADVALSQADTPPSASQCNV